MAALEAGPKGTAAEAKLLGAGDAEALLKDREPSINVVDEEEVAAAPATANLGDFVQFGHYSLFVIVLYELLLLPQMGNMTFMVYGGAAPRVLACGNHSLAHLVQPADACAEMRRLQAQGECPEEQFAQLGTQFGSIAFEFGYLCERIVHIKRSISVQMFGVLCGSIVFGQLSDWFGRKRVMLVAHAGMCILNLAASQAQSLLLFTALQFTAMLFVGGHNTIMHVFLLENMPKRHRVWVMNALSYSPNYVIFAGIAYLCSEWRTLLRVVSALNVPAFLGLLFAFESPRWLIHKARLDEARTVLTRMEHFNGTSAPERLKQIDELIAQEARLCETRKHGRKYHYVHLFYTPRMCANTIVISYALLSISVVSYSMVFGMDALSGSIYLNTAVFGLCRYAMNIAVGGIDFFAPRAGRKHIYAATIVLILAALGTSFCFKLFGVEGPTLMRVLQILAAALCSQLYMLNHVVTTELFPTAVRNIAASFVQIANRTGVVLSPHLFYLAFVWPPLPFLVMIALLAANLGAYLAFIPETKGNSLVDHMPERGHPLFYALTGNTRKKREQQQQQMEPMQESAAAEVEQNKEGAGK